MACSRSTSRCPPSATSHGAWSQGGSGRTQSHPLRSSARRSYEWCCCSPRDCLLRLMPGGCGSCHGWQQCWWWLHRAQPCHERSAAMWRSGNLWISGLLLCGRKYPSWLWRRRRLLARVSREHCRFAGLLLSGRNESLASWFLSNSPLRASFILFYS